MGYTFRRLNKLNGELRKDGKKPIDIQAADKNLSDDDIRRAAASVYAASSQLLAARGAATVEKVLEESP